MKSVTFLDRVRLMKQKTDFSPIVRTMIREGWSKNEDEAFQLIDAFLQWIALVPFTDPKMAYVMLLTPVDHAFHAFVLNTEFYQRFCMNHIGFFVHHNPLDDAMSNKIKSRGGVFYTVELLREQYGEALHPQLIDWCVKVKSGEYTVSSISCVGCDYPDDENLSLKDSAQLVA